MSHRSICSSSRGSDQRIEVEPFGPKRGTWQFGPVLINSVNPWTGETVRSFAPQGHAEVDRALTEAVGAQRKWRFAPLDERLELLRNLSRVLRARKKVLAELITLEMGKPIAESEAEVEKCAYNCDHYAGAAPGYLAPHRIESTATESFVEFEPLGVVLAIMPWNYPFWQLFRFAAPVSPLEMAQS